MANKGDVELVVRARNEASKALDTVTRALSDLAGQQDKLKSSSDNVGSSLSQFTKIASTLASAYDQISSEADRGQAAFQRQEASITEAKAQYQSLTSQMEAAARVLGQLNAQEADDAAGKKALKEQIALVEKAYQQLGSQADKTSRSIEQQEAGLQRSRSALQQTASSVKAAEDAWEKAERAQEEVGASAERVAIQQKSAADSAARAVEQAAADKTAAEQKASADQASAAQQAANAQAAAARRAGLEVRKEMIGAAQVAQTAWMTAQSAIAGLSDKSGPEFANLVAQAKTAKSAYGELQIAVQRTTDTLRSSSTTTEELVAANARNQASLKVTKATLENVASATKQAQTNTQALAQVTQQQAQASSQAAAQTTQLEQAMERLFQNSRRSLSMFQRLRGEVLSLVSTYVGLYAAINGVSQIIQASQDMQAARSRLNVVTDGNTGATAAELVFVRKEADRLGFSFTTLAEQWSKFAAATKGSNLTLEESRRIFTSLSEAGRVLKLNDDAIGRSFLAITQMASKGTIQMEELRGQLGEHLPGAFSIMADAVGVSQAKLTKMMEQGKLTSDFLLPFADQLAKKFGGQLPNALQSTQAELGRFQTAVTMALNTMAENGVLDAFTRALKELRTQLNSDEGQAGLKKIGAIIGAVIDGLMVVIRNLDIIATMLVALGAAKGVGQFMLLVEAVRGYITAIRSAQTATAALGTATAAFGGPWGIALGVLAAGVVYLTTRVSENEKALSSSLSAVDDITAAYRRAKDGAVDWGKELSNVTVQELSKNADTLTKTLADQRQNVGFAIERVFDFSKRSNLLGDAAGPQQQVIDLVKELRSGKKSVVEFRNAISEIGMANPAVANMTALLLEETKALVDQEAAASKANAALHVRQGIATDAEKSLLGLIESTEQSAESLKKAQTAAEQYKAALDDLKKENPVTKLQVQRDKDLEKIKEDTAAALKAAAMMPGGLTEAVKAEITKATQDATEAVNRAFAEGQLRAITKVTTEDTMLASVNTIKAFESYRDKAYWDVNAYRNGYGSDTMTGSDGRTSRVTKDSTTTEADALRDLVRRIGEFQDAIKARIGESRFNAFSPEQQAALTSIAYNYGSLPERIVGAVKNGTSTEIAAAVRTLKGDNGGVNSGRREKEATTLGQQNLTVDSMKAKEDARLAEVAQKKMVESIKSVNDALTVKELRERQTRLEAEIYNETVAKGIPLESAAGQQIAARVTKLYAATAAVEARTAAEKRLNDLVQLRNQLQTAKENAADRGDTAAAEQYALRLAAINDELKKQQEASGALIELLDRKKELQEQINLQSDAGNTDAVAALRLELEGVVAQLDAAVKKSNELGLSLSGPAIQLARQSLKAVNTETKNVADNALSATQINQDFANGLTNAFMDSTKALAQFLVKGGSIKDVFAAAGAAFMQFAADFLMQVAQMIIKQAILNALSAWFGGGGEGGSATGGIGGAIAGMANGAAKNHTGGIAGGNSVSTPASAAWFSNAVRYHGGGIAGLQPNEVPTILERGEEILPETDPRHIKNASAGGSSAPVSVQQTLVLDQASLHAVAASPAGQQVTMTTIKANISTIKQLLKT